MTASLTGVFYTVGTLMPTSFLCKWTDSQSVLFSRSTVMFVNEHGRSHFIKNDSLEHRLSHQFVFTVYLCWEIMMLELFTIQRNLKWRVSEPEGQTQRINREAFKAQSCIYLPKNLLCQHLKISAKKSNDCFHCCWNFTFCFSNGHIFISLALCRCFYL